MKATREKFTKGWKVTAIDPDGETRHSSRLYHSLSAANEYAKLAEKDGFSNVQVRTVEGYDRRP